MMPLRPTSAPEPRLAAGERLDFCLPPAAMLEVAIARIGGRGDGIAETPLGPLFIPLTAPGDRVRVALTDEAGAGRRARLVSVLVAGPARAEPACRHYGECGGCALQHLKAEAQAAWKRDKIAGALSRRGLAVEVPLPLATPPGSRRRAQFAARKRGGEVTIGFNARASHAIAAIPDCRVLRPVLVALLEPLRRLLQDLLREGEAGDVQASEADNGIDLWLRLAGTPDLAGRERLAAFAEANDLARVSWGAGQAETLLQRRQPFVTLGGAPVKLPAGAFLQASREGEVQLARLVTDGIGKAASVLDLYAGLGTFALALPATARVLAVDAAESAIAALRQAARQAARPRLTTVVRDLERQPFAADELAGYEAAIFDPPRAGAARQAAQLACSAVPTVIAVSCSASTFARDARLLVDGGYRLESLQPVDQFLWSPHIELAAVFRRG